MSTVTVLGNPPYDLNSFEGRKWIEGLRRIINSVGSVSTIDFVTVAANPGLPISRRLADSADITFTDGGAGSTITFFLANSGVAAGTYTKVTVDAKGRVTVGASATTADIAESGNLYYTDTRARLALSGTANQINYSSGTGVISAPQNIHTGASPSFVTAILSALTSGRITYATTSGQLTDSANLLFDGTTVTTSKAALKAGTSSGNIAKVGGTIFDTYTTVGNGTTVDTDLITHTLPADVLANNGDKVWVHFGGFILGHATALRALTFYFAGNVVLGSGAVNYATNTHWQISCMFIRVSSSVVRPQGCMHITGAGTRVASNEITGLTLSGTNIIKVMGQASGVGAATNDILGRNGTIEFQPVA